MRDIEAITDERTRIAATTQPLKQPAMQLFIEILRIPHEHASLRSLALLELEKCLASASASQLVSQYNARDVAFDALHASKMSGVSVDGAALQRAYVHAKLNITRGYVGIEHLWRELSHIYSSDVTSHSWMVEHAAHVMLDGFALELQNGDAGNMPEKWVSGILRSLDELSYRQLGRKARIVAVSVLGVQSSGKSTFLNVSFGTRMRTSVGQCTRGVNFQMIRRIEQTAGEVDYIMLLDTEGIRSPEFVGIDDAVQHDNRLANACCASSRCMHAGSERRGRRSAQGYHAYNGIGAQIIGACGPNQWPNSHIFVWSVHQD
jgi:hypothetical protein